MKKFKALLSICTLAFLMMPQSSHAVEINSIGTMSLQGKFRTQATMRTETAPGTRLDFEAGDLVQQRNLLMIEYSWRMGELIPGYTFNMYMQGRATYDGAWDYGSKALTNADYRRTVGFDNQGEVNDKKWDIDLFSGYVDVSGHGAFLRVGKQAFSWGEMSTVRILDGVNPTDSQGFSIDLEERLIPLWLTRANYSFMGVGPFDTLTVEGYYIPGALDNTNADDLANGNPIAAIPQTPYVPSPIPTHTFENDYDGDRYGIKVGAGIGNLAMNLAYYRKYSSPAVTSFLNTSRFTIDTHLDTLPVEVFGMSLNYTAPWDLVIRSEIAYFKDEPLYINQPNAAAGQFVGYELSDVIRAGIGLDRSFNINWLNPSKQFQFTLEYIRTEFLDWDNRTTFPWFDPTGSSTDLLEADRYNDQLVFLASTDYMNNALKPSLTVLVDLNNDTYMFIPKVILTNNSSWEVGMQYTLTTGRTYKGMAVKKDADEVGVFLTYFF